MEQTVLRGVQMRLFPNKRQAELMDGWRRKCIALHNLLLSMEQAAYDGAYPHHEIPWRDIWDTVVHARFEKALEEYKNGRRKKDGSFWTNRSS